MPTIADYFRLFVNRRAYTVQSDRPNPDTGRHYYYRPTDKKTGQGLSLTLDTVRRHIEGEITIALYAINPANERCKWVAIDADYKNALADLIKVGYYLKQDAGVTAPRPPGARLRSLAGSFGHGVEADAPSLPTPERSWAAAAELAREHGAASDPGSRQLSW